MAERREEISEAEKISLMVENISLDGRRASLKRKLMDVTTNYLVPAVHACIWGNGNFVPSCLHLKKIASQSSSFFSCPYTMPTCACVLFT